MRTQQADGKSERDNLGMRSPTRIFWLLAMASTLLVALVVAGWDVVRANEPSSAGSAPSARAAAPGDGPMVGLSGAQSSSNQRLLHAQQDVPLLVVRECPAPVLEDGSLWGQATISALMPLTGLTIFSDVGSPDLFEDDVPLGLIEGDLDLDGILDPGEFWIVGAAFVPATGALVDTIYASGTDEAAVVVHGFAACDLPPVDPPTEAEAAPTATTATVESASEDEFVAAETTPTINKTGDAPAIVAGNEIGFTIDVVNPGPDPLYAVEIHDDLPLGAAHVWDFELIAGDGSCEIIPGEVNVFSCVLGTLDPSETFSVRVYTNTTVDDCGLVENDAQLVWAVTDGGPQDEFISTGFVSLDLECPPLIVETEAQDPEVNVGDDVVFDVTLTANLDMMDVYLDVTLPGDAGWSMSPEDQMCSLSGNSVNCYYSFLEGGAQIVFSVSREATVADCGSSLLNSVHVEGGIVSGLSAAADTDAVNDEATINVVCPDLRVVQSPDLLAVNADEEVEFTVEVFNDGEGDASNVQLVNSLASGIDWMEASISNESCQLVAGEGGPELLCEWTSIPAGENVSVTFAGETGSEDCSDFHFNNAEAWTDDEPSAATDNNFANVQFSVECPALRVEKTPLPSDTISAGATAEYRILVANDGPGEAFDVDLYDELPNGVDWFIEAIEPTFEDADVSCAIVPGSEDGGDGDLVDAVDDALDVFDDDGADVVDALDDTLDIFDSGDATDTGADDGGDAAETNQVLTCTVGSIPATEGVIVFVDGVTDVADCAAPLVNTASASASNEPIETTFTAAASADATITVLCPSLGLTKTASASEINPGEPVSYTLEATNGGPGQGLSVHIRDDVPDGVDWEVVPETPGCAVAEGALDCNVGTLAAGGTYSVTVVGTPGTESCGELSNSASLVSLNHETVVVEPVTITVVCNPELIPFNTANPSEVNAGQLATYTIEVFNDGIGDAVGVVLTDTLPAGVSWIENPETLCTIDGSDLECMISMVPSGESFAVTLEGQTDIDDCAAPLTNNASVEASNHAAVGAEPISITVVCPEPNLALDKAPAEGFASISAGENARFTITVTNSGEGEATGVSLSDPLPAGITWQEVADTDCLIDGQDLTCNIGTMGAVGSDTDVFVVEVEGQSDPSSCADLANTATLQAAELSEPLTSNATIDVNCPALSIVKETGGDVSAGGTAEFTITVENGGAGTALDVALRDELPAGIDWEVAHDGCGIGDNVLTCDFGDLPPTEEASVTISGAAGPEDCGEISNTASVDATNGDPVESELAIITILCPGVAMTKVADAEAVAAGEEIGFTLTVANPQVANALGVSVIDQLPATAGLSWTIDDGADADDCAIDDGVLSCDFGTLPGGQNRVVHITSPTTEESCGTIENTATAEADNEPVNLGDNNTATATVAVNCASISVVKIATDGLGTEIDTADVGDTITYLYFVANTGGVPLTDVVVIDDHFAVEGNLCPAGTTLEPDDGIPGSGADEIVCAGEYLVGELDITDADGLTLTNLATASGVSPLGDEVTGTDDATVTINEPKEPCEFPVTFTFSTDVDFVDDEGNVLFTFPAGLTFFFQPGEVNERGGCTMPFTISSSPDGVPVLASGTMSISIDLGPQASVRALVTDARLLIEVTEVTAWAVPGVPAPEPEVEEVRATIVVSGPVLEIEAGEAKAVIMVEPELEVPFVQTEAYTISTPEVPNTGAGVTASMNAGADALAGLTTLLPVVAAAVYRRRRPFDVCTVGAAQVDSPATAQQSDEWARRT